MSIQNFKNKVDNLYIICGQINSFDVNEFAARDKELAKKYVGIAEAAVSIREYLKTRVEPA